MTFTDNDEQILSVESMPPSHNQTAMKTGSNPTTRSKGKSTDRSVTYHDYSFLAEKIIHSEAATTAYQKSEHDIDKDRDNIITIIQHFYENETGMGCKLRSILSDKTFKIQFCTPSELLENAPKNVRDKGGSINGEFFSKTNTLKFPLGFANNSQNRKLLRHELHHAWVRRQNKIANRFYDSSVKAWLSIPFGNKNGDVKELLEFSKIMTRGHRRVKRLLTIVNKSPRSKIEEKQVVKLRQLTKGYIYEALKMPVNQAQIDRWIEKGKLNKDLTLTKGFIEVTFNAGNLPVYFERFRRIPGANSFEGIIHTVNMEPKSSIERVKALLNDLNISYAFCETAFGRFRVTAELEKDAYIHQVLGPYPELLDFIIPGLRQHHESRSEGCDNQSGVSQQATLPDGVHNNRGNIMLEI